MKTITVLLVAVLTLAGAGQAIKAGQANAGWANVARFHQDRVREAGIVGSSLVLVRDGAVAAHEVTGFQDLDKKVPVDRDTIYHWASITKTFTSIAIMQLRDRGRLSLDDPAVKYVPELAEVHNPFGDMTQVTIRHLMSHSAGFRSATWPWGGDQPWHPFEPTRWEQVVAMLPYTELLFRPGSRYSYSNPGIIFLGRIIEKLSGDEYETYITKNILMPLGMSHAFFDRTPYHMLAHRSHSYFRTDDRLSEARFDFDTGITASNGGLNAPLGDMAKYLSFLLGGKQRGQDEGGVLARSSLDEMFRPVIRATEGEGVTGPDVQLGLSFFIERHGGVEIIGHSGNQNGFLSHFYLHPPSRTAYIVAFNTDVTSRARKGVNVTRAVDGELRDVIVKEIFGRGTTARRN